ncbi:MAG: hypothetical protein ABS76_16815 [Pelagibacterium sp. SCN 64-44]|nr:MAG: hypothetical protein ABS76_16815 [Pelagibacterium sp. SCN 64-44]
MGRIGRNFRLRRRHGVFYRLLRRGHFARPGRERIDGLRLGRLRLRDDFGNRTRIDIGFWIGHGKSPSGQRPDGRNVPVDQAGARRQT